MKRLLTSIILFLSVSSSFALNLATPLAPLPGGRISFSASYDLNGITITNREIPSIMNRIQGNFTISPIQYFNVGIDLGINQIDVASDSNDVALFHGGYGFTGGGNIKVSTPLLKDIIGAIGLAKGTWFSSTEDNTERYYRGLDVAAAIGPIFHIPKFGYISFGPQIYYIHGQNDATSGNYHNINNLRGWIAIEYFPKMKEESKYLPFISIEGSISPEASIKSSRSPVVEFGASITFGAVSSKLFGEVEQIDWKP